MKRHPSPSRSTPAARLLLALMLAGTAHSLHADTFTKADNTTALNDAASWTQGSLVPGANDIAFWDSTVTGPNTVLLGANTTWLGLTLANPGGAVSIDAANTLTLGAGGINMSAATQSLTIGTLATLANTAQTWNAGNQALNVTTFTRSGGSTVNFVNSGGGTINIASGTASAALGGYAVLNSSDYAALDASKNVVAATYADYALGGNLSGTSPGYVGILNITGTTTGSTQAWRNSNAFTVTSGIRFGVNNTQNTKWTVDTSSSGRLLSTSSILVGSAVTQDIEFNGSGGVRASSSNGELILQNFGTGNVIFNTSINGNGTASLVKSGTGKVTIASTSFYTGTTRILAGTLQIGNGGTTGVLGSAAVQNEGILAFNRTDNITVANVVSGSGAVTQAGSGELTLSGVNTYTGATNLNAGALVFNAFTNIGNGTAINFNGGTLKYGAGITTDVSTRILTINSGGGTINTNGNNVTLANSIGNNGTGALTKSGTGTLNLTAANTYSGGTVISAGKLTANNSSGSATGSGAVAVNSGGTLGGSGFITGPVTVNSGGTLAAGNSVGTLTVGSLSLSAGSILDFEFNTSPANDFIAVTGLNGLTLNGGGFNLYSEGTTTAWTTVGTYNLFSFDGTLQGLGLSALSVLNQQAGFSYTFGTSGSFLTLNIAASGLIADWNTDASGSWNTSGNWSGGTVPNATTATARLLSAITAPRTITLDGNKTVGGLTIDNTQAYTINQGSGGTLTFDTGGASAASLTVSGGSHVINAPVALASDLNAGIAASSSVTINGVVSGSKAIVKSGAGNLDLTGANTYSGGTTVTGGTVSFNSGSLGSGAITLDGGGLVYNAGNTQDISSVTVSLGASGGVINTNGNDVTFANAIGNSGAGGLTKAGAGTLVLGSANTYNGATSITGGTLSIGANDRLGSASSGAGLVLNGGTLATTATFALDNGGANIRAITVGSSGGGINVADTTTLTASGVITGSTGTLVKSGAGTLVLSGNSAASFSNAISLTAGTLQAGGAQANGQQGLGTGAIALGNGTTLRANGTGATDNATGYGNLVNALNVASGDTATLLLAKRMTISSVLTGGGTLNVGVDGSRQDYQGNWSAFTGRINLTGAGEFRLANFQNNVFNNTDLHIGDGITVYQIFNPPSSGSLETVQAIGALTGTSGAVIGGNPVGGRFVNWTVGSLNTNTTYAGIIQDGTGAARFTKVGTGSLTLSGASTYTGATSITGGTLIVDGSLGNTVVTVGASGILAGSGTIGGATTVNGALNPGNSPGVLTFSTDLTLAGVGNFEITSATRGTGYDAVNVGGTVTYGGILNLNFGSTFLAGGETFTLFAGLNGADAPLDAGSFTAIELQGAYTASLTNNSGVWTATTGGYDFTFVQDTGLLTAVLSGSPIPEPSTYAAIAGALGLAYAALRRRRRA